MLSLLSLVLKKIEKKKRGGGRIVLFLAQNVCHMYRMYAVTLVRK